MNEAGTQESSLGARRGQLITDGQSRGVGWGDLNQSKIFVPAGEVSRPDPGVSCSHLRCALFLGVPQQGALMFPA